MVEQITRGIDLHARRAADAREGLVDQHAQDLALRLQRHVGDFVQIERAVMRQFEQAGLARPVAALHAEQFGLDPVGRHGGAVDGDKGVAGAARTGMDQPRRHFLARAGGTGDQHAAVGGRDLVDQLAQLGDGRGLADQLALVAGLAASAPALRACSRAASSARSTTCSSRSALNGFSMKS